MIVAGALQVTMGVVIALFLLQLLRRLAAGRSNPIAQGLEGGLEFLLAS
jgi:hypothetical protein